MRKVILTARVAAAATVVLTLLVPTAAHAAVPATPSFTTSVDGYPPADRAICDPTEKAGVQAFRTMMKNANPGVGLGIDGVVRACGGSSDHQEGRAWDWGLETRNPSDLALADEIFTWLNETVNGATHMRARRLGIRYFIWNNQIYVVDGPNAGLEQYSYTTTDANGNPVKVPCSGGWSDSDVDRVCHRNHIHFSWSRAGANKQTTWWSGSTQPTPTTLPMRWVATNYNQSSPAAVDVNYGDTSNWPVVGDWDNDDKQTMGVATADGSWRWALINTNSGGSPMTPMPTYGPDECVPLSGDWDGDDDDTPGVACENNGQWAWSVVNVLSGGSPTPATFNYGSSSCKPIVGDWDGDGDDTVGVVCKGASQWAWSLIDTLSSGSPTPPTFNYGSATCEPVTGNWDGSVTNKTDTIGTACVETDRWAWYLRNWNGAGGNDIPRFTFGVPTGTRPIVGDWNGDHKTTVGMVTKPNDWA